MSAVQQQRHLPVPYQMPPTEVIEGEVLSEEENTPPVEEPPVYQGQPQQPQQESIPLPYQDLYRRDMQFFLILTRIAWYGALLLVFNWLVFPTVALMFFGSFFLVAPIAEVSYRLLRLTLIVQLRKRHLLIRR